MFAFFSQSARNQSENFHMRVSLVHDESRLRALTQIYRPSAYIHAYYYCTCLRARVFVCVFICQREEHTRRIGRRLIKIAAPAVARD